MQRFQMPGNTPMRLNGRCPVCSTAYNFQNVRVLGEKEQQILTYIECGHCGTGVVSILTMNPFGLKAGGIITDLSADEVLELDEGKTISENEVMEMHTILDDPNTIKTLFNNN